MFFFIIIISVISLLFVFTKWKKRKILLMNEHFLITGGSSGIGLGLAIEAAKKGANVTIIARSKERLESSKEEIKSHALTEDQIISTFAADVCEEYETLANIAHEAEHLAGPITYLVNCAGTSVSYRFEETPIGEFSRMLNINYLGSVYMTRAVLPLMKARKSGRITFVSSLAGLVGLYGYTAYSASKFAIVGMAEALQMEVKPFNISITVSFPPDTDTPGFAEEIKCKPLETQRISESGGLFSAEKVATEMLMDTMNGKFMSSVGFEGWLLCQVCSGMTPVHSFVELAIQSVTIGFFRIVSFIYLMTCDKTIKQCALEKEKQDALLKEKVTETDTALKNN